MIFQINRFIIVISIWLNFLKPACMTRPTYPNLDCLEERNFPKLLFQIVRFGAHSGINSYYFYFDARITIGCNSLYEFLDFEIFIA